MYRSLSEYMTKQRYIEVLNETIGMLNNEIDKNSADPYLKCILSQLMVVKNCTKDGRCEISPDLIDSNFDFGGYAVKNLPIDDELGIRLRDLFGGLYEFNSYR